MSFFYVYKILCLILYSSYKWISFRRGTNLDVEDQGGLLL